MADLPSGVRYVTSEELVRVRELMREAYWAFGHGSEQDQMTYVRRVIQAVHGVEVVEGEPRRGPGRPRKMEVVGEDA
jgi:hypothetical protein